jgi:hypothetical protein
MNFRLTNENFPDNILSAGSVTGSKGKARQTMKVPIDEIFRSSSVRSKSNVVHLKYNFNQIAVFFLNNIFSW